MKTLDTKTIDSEQDRFLDYYQALYAAVERRSFNKERLMELLHQLTPDLPVKVGQYHFSDVLFEFLAPPLSEDEAIELLKLIHEKDKNLIKKAVETGRHIIAHTVMAERFIMADFLLDEIKLDIDTRDRSSRTALYYFSDGKCLPEYVQHKVKYLIDRGADPLFIKKGEQLSLYDKTPSELLKSIMRTSSKWHSKEEQHPSGPVKHEVSEEPAPGEQEDLRQRASVTQKIVTPQNQPKNPTSLKPIKKEPSFAQSLYGMFNHIVARLTGQAPENQGYSRIPTEETINIKKQR